MDKEKIKEYRRKYYQEHKEELKVRRREYYQKHKEILKARSRKWHAEHKDYCLKKNREWRRKNPERAATIQKCWREKNPDYYREYMRKRKAATEPLIFNFFDNGFEGDVESFVAFLRENGTPEQHIKWFRTDVKKIMGTNKHR